MKNLGARWLGLLILCLCVSGFGQSGPPPLPAVPLEYWALNRTNWEGWRQELPLGFTNLNAVPSWLNFALSVDTNTTAFLDLPVYAADGYTNVTFDSGSLSFLCQANWTSMGDGGTGPGAWAPLWQVGTYSSDNPSGCWSLAVSPDGNTLAFVTQTNGAGEVHAQIPIVWDAGDWHNLVLTYCATNSSIYLEGALMANMPPIVYWPGPDVCTNGFYVGSDPTGTLQARAQFQELETYGVPLDADFIKDNYDSVAEEILAWGGTLPAVGAGGIGGITQAAGPPILPGMGGGTNGGGGVTNVAGYSTPTYTTNSDVNYNDYTIFWLAVGTSSSNKQAVVTIQNTLSNLTYEILTNSILDTNLAHWGVWQVLTATNSVIVAPPFNIGSNSLFFASQLVLITGTNQIADWWAMKYFGTLAVDPYADPDLDGLCNYSEYFLGSNPTNAHSMSASKTDAPYFFLAYTNDSSTRMRLFQSNSPGTNAVTLTLSNTLVGSNYQIYSKDMSVTNGAWRVETNFLGTNTATQITIPLGGRTLAFIGGDGEDPDGDGLPSGYEVLATHTDPLLADTGNTGIADGFKDPDGDGYVNLTEYYNGTGPLVWDTPAAPGGLNVVLNNSGSSQTATLTWNPSSGSVSSYVIYRDTGSGFVAIATNSATSTSYTDNSLPSNRYANYQIQAIYGNGSSLVSVSLSAFYDPSYNFPIAIVNGPSNRLYLVVSAMPATVTNFAITRAGNGPDSGWEAYYPIEPRWAQESYGFEPIGDGSFSIPASALTNGIVLIPPEEVPPYGSYQLRVVVVGADGKTGGCEPWGMDQMMDVYHIYGTVPFMNATAQMKNNLAFLMSWGYDAFTAYSGYAETNYGVVSYYAYAGPVTYPSNYVYASYYMASGNPNPFMPYEDNCIFSNLQYNASFGHAAHPSVLPTGVSLDVGGPWVDVYVNQAVTFPTLSYVNSGTAPSSPASLIVSNNQWFYLSENWFGPDLPGYPPYLGVYQNGSLWSMSGGYTNNYGLRYQSFEVNNGGGTFALLSPTQSVPAGVEGSSVAYSSVAAPAFTTAGYYFVRLPQPMNYGYEIDPSTYTGPLPGSASFDPTNTTRLLITSVGNYGQPLYVAGYAKQVATNGSPNVFAYLGQYFTNALLMKNGVLTTNIAGIVSEYGSFFPTLPGQVALMTKPDPDHGNLQGQCLINVIRLSLDVNHDGTMDESYTGPDNTTASQPYVFWMNTESALMTSANDPGTDKEVSGPSHYDCNLNCIPSQRDLENWSRLWIAGVPGVPDDQGVIVTLSMTALSGTPAINLVEAVETNGSTLYLSDTNTAYAQTFYSNGSHRAKLGTVSPNCSFVWMASDFANTDHKYFLFEGAGIGEGQLTLTVSKNGTNLAQCLQYLDIHNLKDVYEQAVITDSTSGAISNWTSGLLSVQPAAVSACGNDTNLIVFIHGFNVDTVDWLMDSDTVFKRLYWAGFQGKFMTVNWPAVSLGLWTGASQNFSVFNNSELKAYKASKALKNYLSQLRTRFANYRLNVYAHSQGNAVMGEAIEQGAPFDTYILTQGAMPATCYEIDAPTDQTLLWWEDYFSATPEWHVMGYGGAYTNMTGHILSLYNTNDSVLRIWVADQAAGKPDGFLRHSLGFPGSYYTYDGTDGWDHGLLSSHVVTDVQESRSMISRSRSQPIGRLGPNLGKLGQGVVQSSIDLTANFGFTYGFSEHSAQWTRPIQTSVTYYTQILMAIGGKL